MQALVDSGELKLKPGALELIARLQAERIPKAVATSSNRAKATKHLQKSLLLDRFEAILTREDVSNGKPAPDLFLAAASRLRVQPSECVALEDSYNGVRAAFAAGMSVIMVPDLLPPTAEMGTLCRGIAHDLHSAARLILPDEAAQENPTFCLPTLP
jgi:HAD superfamily hydrolase (TIGR01509 family)